MRYDSQMSRHAGTHPHSLDPFDGTLYVGANYHPHDSSPDVWRRDLDLMRAAGFSVLRAGHLAWDSYEPRDGDFTFEWFDEFLALADDRGIGVILDIAVRPAPLWLHRKHPTMDVVNVQGKRQHANTRYMEDVGDPAYVEHALRYADALVAHYADHPAVLAFGIDNEPGSGPYSYSNTVRTRFIDWLRRKYATTDRLNEAWAGQRWSRRVTDFDDIDLPRSGDYHAPIERMIDFRTFVSDEILHVHTAIIDRVSALAPGKLVTGNEWYFLDSEQGRFFDYAKVAYAGTLTRGGGGFYPGNSQLSRAGLHSALGVISRVQFESPTPYWAVEFTTETAAPGAVRKAAFASLLYGNQMICGWTWQTHHAGEEHYFQGQVDWDGEPNRKYDEYKKIAHEFRAIEKFGFPYAPRAEVAIAFSFSSQLASSIYPEKHDRQLEVVFDTFLERNLDIRVVDLLRSELAYQVLIMPGVAIIDEATADRVRQFVTDGGTVIMTSFSACLDEHGQVFRTPRPGLLHDVFGVRLGPYQEPEILNEVTGGELTGQRVRIDADGALFELESPRFDDVHTRGADVIATITGHDREYPAVTVNAFGEGRAIYVSLPARDELMDWVIGREVDRRGIRSSVVVPAGVIARQTDRNHALYVNLAPEPRTITLPDRGHGVLSDTDLGSEFDLPAFDVEFVAFG